MKKLHKSVWPILIVSEQLRKKSDIQGIERSEPDKSGKVYFETLVIE